VHPPPFPFPVYHPRFIAASFSVPDPPITQRRQAHLCPIPLPPRKQPPFPRAVVYQNHLFPSIFLYPSYVSFLPQKITPPSIIRSCRHILPYRQKFSSPTRQLPDSALVPQNSAISIFLLPVCCLDVTNWFFPLVLLFLSFVFFWASKWGL